MSNSEQPANDLDLDDLNARVIDLSARLCFVERVLSKMAELQPEFATHFNNAAHRVAVEKAESALTICNAHANRLREINAPAIILDMKVDQIKMVQGILDKVSSTPTESWAEGLHEELLHRERQTIHCAACNWDNSSTENALPLVMGLTLLDDDQKNRKM